MFAGSGMSRSSKRGLTAGTESRSNPRMNRLFVFGLGFTGVTLARRVISRGWQVAGTVRSREKAARLRGEGIDAVVFDGAGPGADVAAALEGASCLVQSIAPNEGGDPVLAHHRRDLARQAGGIRWLGYLSTIGVYGDHGGAWVDEETPTDPISPRNLRRVEAEREWAAFGDDTGVPVMLFRIAGIYGPGRNALVNVKTGIARRIVKPGQVFNRIHVEDIARVLEASMTRPRAGAVYNVGDDEPGPPQDVVAYAAGLLGAAPLPDIAFEEADLTPMGRSFYSANRRARNGRIRTELGVKLKYPTYRDGLDALLAAGEGR